MPHPRTPAALDPSVSVVVAASPDLDDAAATRLLRWCQARLHLFDNRQVAINHSGSEPRPPHRHVRSRDPRPRP